MFNIKKWLLFFFPSFYIFCFLSDILFFKFYNSTFVCFCIWCAFIVFLFVVFYSTFIQKFYLSWHKKKSLTIFLDKSFNPEKNINSLKYIFLKRKKWPPRVFLNNLTQIFKACWNFNWPKHLSLITSKYFQTRGVFCRSNSPQLLLLQKQRKSLFYLSSSHN